MQIISQQLFKVENQVQNLVKEEEKIVFSKQFNIEPVNIKPLVNIVKFKTSDLQRDNDF